MGKFNRGDSRGGGFSGGHGGHGGGFGGRGGGGGRPNFRGNDRGPVVMSDATCSECGKPCRVPFRPSGDKPVYCNDCFNKRGGGKEAGYQAGRAPMRSSSPDGFSQNDIKTQLAMINIKLDKLTQALGGNKSAPVKKEIPMVEEMASEAPIEKVKKVVKTKKVSKK